MHLFLNTLTDHYAACMIIYCCLYSNLLYVLCSHSLVYMESDVVLYMWREGGVKSCKTCMYGDGDGVGIYFMSNKTGALFPVVYL